MSSAFGVLLFVLMVAYSFGVHWSTKSIKLERKICALHSDDDAEY
jgi:hypothetical protein